MLVILLTHADAATVNPPYIFRPLSAQGRQEVDQLAQRFLASIQRLAPDLAEKEVTIGEILSSPMARCIETGLRFCDPIKEYTSTSEIRVRDRLGEKRLGQLSAGDLVSVLDQCHAEAVVVCCHGDLAGALPKSAKLKPGAHKNGWFQVRPVLAVVRYERGGDWDQAQVLCCESPSNNWQSLLV